MSKSGSDITPNVVTYPLAEKFKSVQGEGMHTGKLLGFIRFVGCSVGQNICTHCDTHFDKMYPNKGGGLHSIQDIIDWLKGVDPCITGGEPLDRDIWPLVRYLLQGSQTKLVHIETSGTRKIDDLGLIDALDNELLWLTVSPKPGYLPELIDIASEIKVIVGGLGAGLGWPTIKDAVQWADQGKLVYLQPRNKYDTIDNKALNEAICLVEKYPQLRLSAQLHKFLHVR